MSSWRGCSLCRFVIVHSTVVQQGNQTGKCVDFCVRNVQRCKADPPTPNPCLVMQTDVKVSQCPPCFPPWLNPETHCSVLLTKNIQLCKTLIFHLFFYFFCKHQFKKNTIKMIFFCMHAYESGESVCVMGRVRVIDAHMWHSQRLFVPPPLLHLPL